MSCECFCSLNLQDRSIINLERTNHLYTIWRSLILKRSSGYHNVCFEHSNTAETSEWDRPVLCIFWGLFGNPLRWSCKFSWFSAPLILSEQRCPQGLVPLFLGVRIQRKRSLFREDFLLILRNPFVLENFYFLSKTCFSLSKFVKKPLILCFAMRDISV